MSSYFRKMSLSVLGRTSYEGKHLFSEDYVREWCTNHQSKFVELNGVELHYRDEGQGPVLVLIHGFGGSLHNWNEWVSLFKGKYRIIRFDLPGFGLSSPVRRKMEIKWFVEVFKSLMDHLGIEEFYLCGNSLGGWLSWEFVASYPERVKKLILMNSAGYFEEAGKPAGIELMAKEQFRKLLRTGAPKILVRQIAKGSFGDKSKLTDDLVHRTYLMINRVGMLASLIYIASSDARATHGKVHLITTPTLILWGAKDTVIPVSHADLFYSDLKNSKLIIYKEAGHVPMMELPELSANDAEQFLIS
jgi:pimeloyl-ACP methyl ester carboxylesterase